MSNGIIIGNNLIVGLAIGIVVGILVGILIKELIDGRLTSITRDTSGRIIEVMERGI